MTILAQGSFSIKRANRDGYSCSLTSYSTMLNSDSNGVIGTLAAAVTTVKLYQGSTAVTPVISIDAASNCSASISGLNVSIVSVPNNTKLGYVDIKVVYGSFVKIERYTFSVVDYTVVKNYTQTIVGDQMTSYATKNAVDILGQTVSDQSTTIQQNSKDIALKASKKDVSDLGDRMTSAEASITPDAINLTVKSQIGTAVGNAKDEIKASFSIGTDGISMLGKKISLTGMVSFKSLSDYSDVDGRISTAQTTANNAKTGLGTLTNSLGNLAYKSLVEQAMKEEGLISGAFLKMSLIDVKNVVAQGISAQKIDAGNATIKNLNVDTVKMTNADVTGNITATSGSIGMFSINKLFGLSSASSTSSFFIDSEGIAFVGSGTNAGSKAVLGPNSADYPLTAGVLCPGRFEVTRVGSASANGNAGLYISVTGITGFNDSNLECGNNALYIANGSIYGFRPRSRSVYSSLTLSDMDSTIFTFNTNWITLSLPSSPQNDQAYYIRRCESGGVTISGGGHFITYKNRSNTNTTVDVGGWQGVILHWNATYNMWWIDYTTRM